MHGTPVDRALPMLAAVVTLLAAFSHAGIAVAAPLLMCGEIVVADERTRLLWFGVVLAASFGAALAGGKWTPVRAVVCTAGAIVVLRWIPLGDVRAFRELLLIAIAIGIVAALRWSPFGVAVAVVTALFTPAIPLRTLALPLFVLLVCGATRVSRVGARIAARRSTEAVFALVLAVPLLFFAWSGAFARSLPIVFRGPIHPSERFAIRLALKPGESVLLDVPPTARHLVLSGANMPQLRPGTPVARIEPQGIVVRIGDIADWGAFRREQYYRSRNALPRDSAGVIRGYGYSAWIDGAGRVPVAGTHMRVVALRQLPEDALLQVEGFEF